MPVPTSMTPRAAAARILVRVVTERRSLSAVLGPGLNALTAQQDRPLVQELCYGVLRWYFRLAALAGQLFERQLKRRDVDVHCLVLIGLYQLLYMRVPPHAAVAETVAATRALGKPWASALVNAVLRRFQRESVRLCATVDMDPSVATAHPAWLLDLIREQWPPEWEAVVAANNARPPMILRVNRARTSTEEFRQMLAHAGLEAEPSPHVPGALKLRRPVDTESVPGFEEGLVSVQDAAAQLAAGLMRLAPGQRVLDACAAPGGKTAHILETLAAHEDARPDVTAVDIDEQRLGQVRDNLRRLGFAARLVTGDVAALRTWWDGIPYDRILLDAPCSATGVLRRHPDIKLLRRATDIDTLAARQRRLLAALWPSLKPGGILLYATCSILHQENEAVIATFCRDTAGVRPVRIDATWGRATGAGRQILPVEGGMDGFYYARLEKE